MSEPFDPLDTGQLITTGYRRYLRSLLPVRDPGIAAALDIEIQHTKLLTKGPLLEATPPYQHGAALEDLIDGGVLCPAVRALASDALPLARPLYVHQELAIRKIAAGRNVIIASGTGSGKTESFLVPILEALSAERERSELSPGVRALLLYPMNALANDQVKRLRRILAKTPQITFGRYVGDTSEDPRRAEEKFAALNPGEPRLSNELLSREEMRNSPPHLLLTNYAMLEYLLLRPADIDLFEGPYAGRWQFLVLDEAHVYDGAKAAEVAMLIRRLRDRVARGQQLRCIATSATVGDEPHKVTEFATKLFDSPFEWADDDPSRQDLIRTSRIALPKEPFWGPLEPAAYVKIAAAADPAAELLVHANTYGPEVNAGLMFATEERMAKLRELLATGPRFAAQLAQELFDPDVPEPERRTSLDAMVTAGSRIMQPDGMPVLSARYHLFVRATEGAFTCLSQTQPHVSLSRREQCDACSAPMFEIGTCKRCGALYLPGAITYDETGRRTFGLRRSREQPTWLLVDNRPSVIDEDDETLEQDTGALDADQATLCANCGSLQDGTHRTCPQENCRSPRLVAVRKLKTHQDSIFGCLACGARGSAQVRAFESGSDAAVSVVATALYNSLPPAGMAEQADQPGEGRKLLSFSDSRQAAAFFAPYLQSSYDAIQHRRLLLQGLERATEHGAVSVSDLTYHTAQAAADAHVFERRESAQERQRRVALWVMCELTATDARQSLEGQGLWCVQVGHSPDWPSPIVLTRLGLTVDEAWMVLAELVRSIRQQGAITMETGVDPGDEAFNPRRGPIYVRSDGALAKRKVISWLPTRGKNRRLDYVARLVAAIAGEADPSAILQDCWSFIADQPQGWLALINERGLGIVRQLDHKWLRFDVSGAARPGWQCQRCRTIAAVAVRGVCPTMSCDGKLVPSRPENDGHYRYLYRTMNPVPMAAREHTAQLTSEYAADIQQQFVRGEVNVLSCSTTFELGVDVGELQTVVLRNMPPTTANYVQRAGRAGRRTESAALVVTYAQRRSHDLAKFSDPVSMVAGEMRAPYVPLGNERIDRRHAHSIALAAFFRQAKGDTGVTWRNAGDFFLGNSPTVNRVRPYLTPVPKDLTDALCRVLPAEVQSAIGTSTGAWVDNLCELLEAVRAELTKDVSLFEERRDHAAAEHRYKDAGTYQRTINTLISRDLIGLLANRNVLPKYGFPTDTVELRTRYTGDPLGLYLDLSRDLTSAIYEYAPGSEVVAGGRLWTSGGVYRLPDRELVGRSYAVCLRCAHYEEGDELSHSCPSCLAPRQDGPRDYVIPEFGFVARRDVKSPGTVAPLRAWNGATYVLSPGANLSEETWKLRNGVSAVTRAGERGELIAISEGPRGRGYLICERCGWGASVTSRPQKSHPDPLRNRECSGPRRPVSLAHKYETDLLEITFDLVARPRPGSPQWRSVLYALLEGASNLLDISRDDIDGTLYPQPGGRLGLVLFDSVPGGAGGVIRIAHAFPDVLRAAHHRVSSCDCGEETSCYGCLRTFRNQTFHDDLRRGDAVDFLALLVDR